MFVAAMRRASRVRILDGGMGVLLPKLGVPKDPILWSARALIDDQYHPAVVQAHREFIKAGASAIISNSYAVIPGYLRKFMGPNGADAVDQATRLCDIAGRLAREAAGPRGAKESALVLGSLPPLIDSYRADLLLPKDEAEQWYAMMARAMAPHVDLYVAETMSCPSEAACAVTGVAEALPDAKVWVCFTVDSQGRCRDGTAFNDAVRGLSGASNVTGVGVNCCMPEAVELAMASLDADPEASAFASSVERVVYANAYPKSHSEGLEYDTENFDDEAVREDLGADRYAEIAADWARRERLPFTVIGGCCGILPSHMERVSASLSKC